MKCKNITSLINGNFIIRIKDKDYEYENKEKVEEDIKNYDVTSIYVRNSTIVIEAKLNEKIRSLEELGYSFEVGVGGD